MEFVSDYLAELVAFVQQETQIANTGLFAAGDSGSLSCVITPEAIAVAGPAKVGRELRLSVRLSAPISDYPVLFAALAKLDKVFTGFGAVTGELKLNWSAVMGGWSRVSDPSNVVFVLSLTLLGVRQGA